MVYTAYCMWDILHIVWDILHIVCGIYCILYVGYTAYCMGYTAYCMAYTAHCMGYTTYCIGYTVQYAHGDVVRPCQISSQWFGQEWTSSRFGRLPCYYRMEHAGTHLQINKQMNRYTTGESSVRFIDCF